MLFILAGGPNLASRRTKRLVSRSCKRGHGPGVRGVLGPRGACIVFDLHQVNSGAILQLNEGQGFYAIELTGIAEDELLELMPSIRRVSESRRFCLSVDLPQGAWFGRLASDATVYEEFKIPVARIRMAMHDGPAFELAKWLGQLGPWADGQSAYGQLQSGAAKFLTFSVES